MSTDEGPGAGAPRGEGARLSRGETAGPTVRRSGRSGSGGVSPLFDPEAARAARVLASIPANQRDEPDAAADPVRTPASSSSSRAGKPVLVGVALLLALGIGTAVLLNGSGNAASHSPSASGDDLQGGAPGGDGAAPSGTASPSPLSDKQSDGHTASTTATPKVSVPSPVASKTAASGPAVSPTPHVAAAKTWTTVVVRATSVLTPGRAWHSNRTSMAMTSDGDLVIRDENNHIRWSAGTAGRGYKTVFQGDGNFAIYTKDGATAWSTRTDGHNGATLILRADGDVAVVYGGTTIWHSGTQH